MVGSPDGSTQPTSVSSLASRFEQLATKSNGGSSIARPASAPVALRNDGQPIPSNDAPAKPAKPLKLRTAASSANTSPLTSPLPRMAGSAADMGLTPKLYNTLAEEKEESLKPSTVLSDGATINMFVSTSSPVAAQSLQPPPVPISSRPQRKSTDVAERSLLSPPDDIQPPVLQRSKTPPPVPSPRGGRKQSTFPTIELDSDVAAVQILHDVPDEPMLPLNVAGSTRVEANANGAQMAPSTAKVLTRSPPAITSPRPVSKRDDQGVEAATLLLRSKTLGEPQVCCHCRPDDATKNERYS